MRPAYEGGGWVCRPGSNSRMFSVVGCRNPVIVVSRGIFSDSSLVG
jgi:hypothetical protein